MKWMKKIEVVNDKKSWADGSYVLIVLQLKSPIVTQSLSLLLNVLNIFVRKSYLSLLIPFGLYDTPTTMCQ